MYLFVKRYWNTKRAPSTTRKASTQLKHITSEYWAAFTTFILIYFYSISYSNFTFVNNLFICEEVLEHHAGHFHATKSSTQLGPETSGHWAVITTY